MNRHGIPDRKDGPEIRARFFAPPHLPRIGTFSYLCLKRANTRTMSKLIIRDFDDFTRYTGQELGVSDYLKITQEQINLFADATLDHQWIHVDPERARTESPYKTTIAHGYLTLSLLPYLWGQVLEVQNVKMLVNYGIEKLRFNQPVAVFRIKTCCFGIKYNLSCHIVFLKCIRQIIYNTKQLCFQQI